MPLAFRNVQLGKVLLPRWIAKLWFRATDVFVVEIASMLEYKIAGMYFHRDFYDAQGVCGADAASRELILGAIEVGGQLEQEVRDDIDEIVKLLGRNRVLFVTHLSTKNVGARADFIKIVKSQLSILGVTFIDPSTLLERWESEDIFERETVLSHYTLLGHSLIGQIYFEEINKILGGLQRKQPQPIIQVVDNTKEKVRLLGSQGWGDAILGAANVFQVVRKTNREAFIDWSYFSGSRFLQHGERSITDEPNLEMNVINRATYLFHGSQHRKFTHESRVFTNARPQLPLYGPTRDFLLRAGVRPGFEVSSIIDDFLSAHGLREKEFSVIQFRFGDGAVTES